MPDIRYETRHANILIRGSQDAKIGLLTPFSFGHQREFAKQKIVQTGDRVTLMPSYPVTGKPVASPPHSGCAQTPSRPSLVQGVRHTLEEE